MSTISGEEVSTFVYVLKLLEIAWISLDGYIRYMGNEQQQYTIDHYSYIRVPVPTKHKSSINNLMIPIFKIHSP